MVFIVIGAVLLGAVIFAGGGNTLSGFGKDLSTASERIQNRADQ